jgi:hypothetical protein
MVTKDQLNRYLSVIFRPLPGLIINTANSQRDVGGDCMYNRSADSYSITIYILKSTSESDAACIMFHENGHISLDRKNNNPGDHFRVRNVLRTASYMQREVSAWIEGDIFATRFGLHEQYKSLAMSIINPDIKLMTKMTRQLWEAWLNV